MKTLFRIRFLDPRSDNRKSKTCGEPSRTIQNRNFGFLVGAMLSALGFSSAVVFALSFPVEAQQPMEQAVRIGYLGNAAPPLDAAREEAFLQGLREHGWVEGRNITIERRYWENRTERLTVLADELASLNVAVIVTTSGTGARALKKTTSETPIVMMASADAVTQGLVASLARPGANITGLTNISPESTGKRLELLKEAFPKSSRVAVLGCAQDGAVSTTQWQEAQAAARFLKLNLQTTEVRGPEEIVVALSVDGVDALLVLDCSRIPSSKTVHIAATRRLPAIYPSERFAAVGGLMMYGPGGTDLARRTAGYVDKILKGRRPADLPVEQPTIFELLINLKTAKQIGVTIPHSVLYRADRVIR